MLSPLVTCSFPSYAGVGEGAPGPYPHRLTSAKVTRGKGALPRGRARRACACAPMRTCVCADVRGRVCARTYADVLCACARPHRAWDCGCAGRRRPGAGSGCSLLFSFRPPAPSRIGAAWGEGCGGPGSGVFSSRHAFLGFLGWCGELATPPSLPPPTLDLRGPRNPDQKSSLTATPNNRP